MTYTLGVRGKLFVAEHVPARVCVETGEQLFSPETVERCSALSGEEETETIHRDSHLDSTAQPGAQADAAKSAAPLKLSLD